MTVWKMWNSTGSHRKFRSTFSEVCLLNLYLIRLFPTMGHVRTPTYFTFDPVSNPTSNTDSLNRQKRVLIIWLIVALLFTRKNFFLFRKSVLPDIVYNTRNPRSFSRDCLNFGWPKNTDTTYSYQNSRDVLMSLVPCDNCESE